MRVRVQVDSDKLEFPRGDTLDYELSRRNTTRQFSVRARTAGTFPLRVVVTSPDGALVLGESRVTIRSTAASGVGVVLSVGALLLLLTWWARDVLRGERRSRRGGYRRGHAGNTSGH